MWGVGGGGDPPYMDWADCPVHMGGSPPPRITLQNFKSLILGDGPRKGDRSPYSTGGAFEGLRFLCFVVFVLVLYGFRVLGFRVLGS